MVRLHLMDKDHVTTSQPAPTDLETMWDKLLESKYDDIIYIPMSSGLSSSYQTACMLSEDYNGAVYVVDAHRISVTQRHAVMDAVALKNQGFSAASIKEILERNAFQSIIFVGVDDIEYLKRGGRLTPGAAAIASVLNIKPLLTIQGEKIDSYAKMRGNKKCQKQLIKIMKEKKKLTIGGIFSQIVLLILAVIVLYPLAFMFLTSIKSNLDVLTNPFGITTFKPENYVSAWKIGKIGSFFMNSVIITIMTMAVQLIVIILASFALGKLRPWGSGFIEILFLSGLFITSEMLTIPNFTTLKAWGLNGTRLALLLPYVTLGLPTATFIMINYVKGLPKELDEAALLDGCSLLQNLFRITLPLLKPVIATVMIFNFQGTWSEFYWALIEIKKDSLKTLPLGLMNFNSMYNTDYGVLCAGLCIATIPVVLLYLKCSSYFIGGMVAGAVKG